MQDAFYDILPDIGDNPKSQMAQGDYFKDFLPDAPPRPDYAPVENDIGYIEKSPNLSGVLGAAKEIGTQGAQATVQLAKDIGGSSPLETAKQTSTGLLTGMVAFADSTLARAQELLKQAVLNDGDIDWETIKEIGDARQKLYSYEPTDKAAKQALNFVSAVPTGGKEAFHQTAKAIDHPEISAAIETAGDIYEILAFGKVFEVLKGEGRGEAAVEPPKGEPPKLDTGYAKKLIRDRMAQEKTKGVQRPLDRLKRTEETLASDRADAEMLDVFKDILPDKEKAYEPKAEVPVPEREVRVPEQAAEPAVEPKPGGVTPEAAGAIIPDELKSSQHADKIGTANKGDEAAISALRNKQKEFASRVKEATDDQERMDMATQAQFFREAAETAGGEAPFTPKPVEPKPTEQPIKVEEQRAGPIADRSGEYKEPRKPEPFRAEIESKEGRRIPIKEKSIEDLKARRKKLEILPERYREWGMEKDAKAAEDALVETDRLIKEKQPKPTEDVTDTIGQTINGELTAEPKKPAGEPLMESEGVKGKVVELKKRSVADVAKDVNTLIGKKGEIVFKGAEDLNPEQQAALMRLKGDLKVIKKNAERTGKSIEKYLVDLGYDPKVAKILHDNSDKIPKYAGSINVKKQDIPEDYKAFESDLMATHKKKTQSWDKTEKLSKQYTDDVGKAASLFERQKRGTLNLTTEKIHAMRQINANAIEGLKKVVDMGDIKQANESLKNYQQNILKVTSDASSEIGRMLNIHKKEVSIARMGKALNKLKDGLNERQFEELKRLNLENPVEVKSFIKRLDDPKLSDYLLEYWYNNILSGPPTHIVNIAGNTLWSEYQVPHRGLMALVDIPYAKLTGKERQFFINEIVPMLAGYKSGFKRGRVAAGEMFRKGKVTHFEDKWALEMGTSIGAFERSPHKILRKLAFPATFFTRGLRAMDVWANAIAYDSEVNSMARRASNKAGVKGDARFEFEKKFAENLTDEQHLEAVKQSKHFTFMDDPDPLTKKIIETRNLPVIGPVLRFTVAPFVNTISNLTKRGIEMTPGLGILKEAASRGMGRGRPTPDVIAKQIEGAMIALYVMNKVENGEITGPMPDSYSERQEWHRMGKVPWAMQFGDTWYSYRRYEPFNTSIASIAIGYQRIKEAMENDEEDKATEIFSDVAHGIYFNILDGSYFSGLQSAFNRHDKSVGEGIAKFAASWVPYSSFWRSINRSMEVVAEGSAKPREGDEIIKAFAGVIPGLSGKMPAKLNVWGKEAVIPGGVFRQWLPYKWAKEVDDPVEKALEKLEIYPTLPRKNVVHRGEKVELPDDIYRKYCIDYGHELKRRFDEQVLSSQWDNYNDKQRADVLEKVRRRTIRYARRRLDKYYLEKR